MTFKNRQVRPLQKVFVAKLNKITGFTENGEISRAEHSQKCSGKVKIYSETLQTLTKSLEICMLNSHQTSLPLGNLMTGFTVFREI